MGKEILTYAVVGTAIVFVNELVSALVIPDSASKGVQILAGAAVAGLTLYAATRIVKLG